MMGERRGHARGAEAQFKTVTYADFRAVQRPEAGSILGCFELRLGERMVVPEVWPAVGPDRARGATH